MHMGTQDDEESWYPAITTLCNERRCSAIQAGAVRRLGRGNAPHTGPLMDHFWLTRQDKFRDVPRLAMEARR